MPRQVKKNSTEVPETIVAQATAPVVDIKVEKTAKAEKPVKAKKEPKVEAVVAAPVAAVEE
jgi:hypothetical protein